MEKMIKDWVLGKVLAACSQIKQCQNLMYDMTQLESCEIRVTDQFDEYLNTLTHSETETKNIPKKDYLNRKPLLWIAIQCVKDLTFFSSHKTRL